MHLRRLFTLALLVVVNSMPAQVVHSREADGLHGPVKAVVQVFRGDTNKSLYDSIGKAMYMQEPGFSCGGREEVTSSSDWYYDYSPDGKLRSAHNFYSYMIVKIEDEEDNFHSADYYFTWNADGKVHSIYSVFSGPKDPPRCTIVFAYDRKGNMISESSYSRETSSRKDSLVRKIHYRYDKFNRVVWQETTGYWGKKMQTHDKRYFVYNSNGKLQEQHDVGDDKKITTMVVYTYDEQGRLQEEMAYWDNGGNPRYQKTMMYTDTSTTETYLSYRDGKPGDRSVSVFNAEHDVVSIISYNASGAVESDFMLQYEYDQYGNWTSRKMFEKNEQHCEEYRSFEYWK